MGSMYKTTEASEALAVQGGATYHLIYIYTTYLVCYTWYVIPVVHLRADLQKSQNQKATVCVSVMARNWLAYHYC